MISKTNDEKIKQFIDMLQYAPNGFIDKVLNRLKEYEKMDQTEL